MQDRPLHDPVETQCRRGIQRDGFRQDFETFLQKRLELHLQGRGAASAGGHGAGDQRVLLERQ